METPGNTVTGRSGPAGPAHAARPWPPPARVFAVAAGVAAALTAVGLGAAGCLAAIDSARSTPISASLITVTPGADTARTTP